MELKVGQTIYAINECVMDDDEIKTLTIGKGYEIIHLYNTCFDIKDDVGEWHSFEIENFAEYFTTEPPKKERYFIVFFKGNTSWGHWHLTTNGEYPNAKETAELIKITEGEKWVVFTNIIELNQQDYESWNK